MLEIVPGNISCLALGFVLGALFVTTLWMARRSHKRHHPDYTGRSVNGNAVPSTDLAKLILAAHQAAQELDAALTVGDSQEIVDRAYRAEQSARWLAAKIRANEDREKTS
jgi:hypothetical protein